MYTVEYRESEDQEMPYVILDDGLIYDRYAKAYDAQKALEELERSDVISKTIDEELEEMMDRLLLRLPNVPVNELGARIAEKLF